MAFSLLSRHTQFFTFAAVGLANTAVHGCILVLSVEYFGLDATSSNAAAFFLANIFSYFANSKLTFKTHISLARYSRFFLASLLSLAITLTISATAEYLGMHYLIGFALIVACVPIFSFAHMKIWTFSAKEN